MKLKKTLVGLAVLTALIGLAACSNSSSTSSSSSGSSNSQYLDKIVKNKELVVATSAEFAPFEFQTVVNGKNQIVGSDIDLANAIGKALGVKVVVQNMDFDNVLASVQTGKADIAIAGISATPDREKAFDFSTPYYQPSNAIVVKKSDLSKYSGISSLDGKQITAQKGSTQEMVAQSQLSKATLVSLPGNSDEVTQVESGQVVAAVMDSIVAKNYVDTNSDLAIAKISLTKTAEDAAFAVGMPKNSGELKTKIDKVISDLKASGEIQKMIDKNITLSEKSTGK